MCNRICHQTSEHAIGEFLKGNEPEPIRMRIIVALCQCGLCWARVEGGTRWVEAHLEKQDAA